MNEIDQNLTAVTTYFNRFKESITLAASELSYNSSDDSLREIQKQCKTTLQYLAEQAVIQSIFTTAQQLLQAIREEEEEARQAWRMRTLASMHTDRTTPRSIEELKARIKEYRQ